MGQTSQYSAIRFRDIEHRMKCTESETYRIMEHCVDNRVALYTMTENFETGGNDVIECLFIYLESKNVKVGLPNVLIFQMGN